jgi:hypothetical protein
MQPRLLTLAVAALLVSAIPAAAQRRVPNTGMWALGGSIGAGMPPDPSLAGGLDLSGNLEGYLTPRVSVRGQLGGASTDIVGRDRAKISRPQRQIRPSVRTSAAGSSSFPAVAPP